MDQKEEAITRHLSKISMVAQMAKKIDKIKEMSQDEPRGRGKQSQQKEFNSRMSRALAVDLKSTLIYRFSDFLFSALSFFFTVIWPKSPGEIHLMEQSRDGKMTAVPSKKSLLL